MRILKDKWLSRMMNAAPVLFLAWMFLESGRWNRLIFWLSILLLFAVSVRFCWLVVAAHRKPKTTSSKSFSLRRKVEKILPLAWSLLILGVLIGYSAHQDIKPAFIIGLIAALILISAGATYAVSAKRRTGN